MEKSQISQMSNQMRSPKVDLWPQLCNNHCNVGIFHHDQYLHGAMLVVGDISWSLVERLLSNPKPLFGAIPPLPPQCLPGRVGKCIFYKHHKGSLPPPKLMNLQKKFRRGRGVISNLFFLCLFITFSFIGPRFTYYRTEQHFASMPLGTCGVQQCRLIAISDPAA